MKEAPETLESQVRPLFLQGRDRQNKRSQKPSFPAPCSLRSLGGYSPAHVQHAPTHPAWLPLRAVASAVPQEAAVFHNDKARTHEGSSPPVAPAKFSCRLSPYLAQRCHRERSAPCLKK